MRHVERRKEQMWAEGGMTHIEDVARLRELLAGKSDHTGGQAGRLLRETHIERQARESLEQIKAGEQG